MPPEISDQKIFADVSEKKGKGVKFQNKRRKIVKGRQKIGNGSRKVIKKEVRTFFFFFFCFSLLKTMEIGSTKMGIFYQKKAFLGGKKKSRKMTLPPQKNMPVTPLPKLYLGLQLVCILC